MFVCVVLLWVLTGGGPTCVVVRIWVYGVQSDANKDTIAAAGGVEAIVQGMTAHVGVAQVQEWGAGALWALGSNCELLLVPLRVQYAVVGGCEDTRAVGGVCAEPHREGLFV